MKTGPNIIVIRSENSHFQAIETLRRNRTKRRKRGEIFVEGVRPISQAVAAGWRINALAYTPVQRLSAWAQDILQKAEARTHYHLQAPLMSKLSQKDNPSELIALVAMPPDDLERIPITGSPLVVVLDRPASPGNIGAVIRSCDALRASGVIITGHSADLYDPETIQATTGSFFRLPSVRLPSHKELLPWLASLKEHHPGLQVVGTSEKAQTLIQEHDFTRPTVLLLGSEAHGLSQSYRSLFDTAVAIPMYGSASSLNLACAASIILYEIDRQRRQLLMD
jgi:23S rRNA (uridine2479-2'-O)-methyltransferase